MVNAQQYIENNFPKHVSEISAAGKDLEGYLDLSEYPNVVKLDIGVNSWLTSLKLAPSSKITWISLYGTSIDNFSFLADAPNLQTICLPRTGDQIGGGSGNGYIAKALRESCQEKEREIERLQQQITQLQSSNQQNNQNQQIITNLNQTLAQINILNSQLNQQVSQQQQIITQLQTELVREKNKSKHLMEQLTQIEQPPK